MANIAKARQPKFNKPAILNDSGDSSQKLSFLTLKIHGQSS